jgi:hypothetical protein
MSDIDLDKLEELITEQNPEPEETDSSKQTGDVDASTGKNEETKGSEDKDYPEGAVIAAKSGTYTIPFEELAKAREAKHAAEASALAAQNEIRQLREALAQRETQQQTPEAPEEEKVFEPDFGDFSPEAIQNGLKQFLEHQSKTLDSHINKAITPILQSKEQDVYAEHLRLIHEKHPDADSIIESVEFANWAKAQPQYRQRSIDAVLQNGSTTDVVELFDDFKSSLTQTSQTPVTADAIKTATESALKAAKAKAPFSLSEIPDGRAGSADPLEEINNLSPQAQLAAVANLSRDQFNRWIEG